MASNSDFFLNFGSNAKTWASGLSGELKPATESITSLTTALERYDAATNNRKSNGPLDSLFTRLDQVSDKFSELTGSLAATFDKAIQGMNLLREDMNNLLQSVQGVSSAARATKRGPGRPALTTVDENDAQSAAKVRNAQTLKANVDATNRQLERLAELNQTLAGRMNEAGDKTIILGRSVDGLRTAADKAVLGIDVLESRLSRLGEGVVINAPAGSAGGVGAADMSAVMASMVEALRGVTISVGEANIQAARVVSQVETAAKATTAEALETQRYTTTTRSEMQGPQINKRVVEGSKRELPVLEGAMWDQPAKAGTYAVGTQKVPFRNADLIAGETFNEHYARMGALTGRFNAVQRQLPTAQTLDPTHGPMLQKISDAFFKGGGVHADAVTRVADRGYLAQTAALQESIRANRGSRFVAGAQDERLIKRAQEAGLGHDMQSVVERALQFTSMRRVGVDTVPGSLPAARAEHLERFIADELHKNPMQTFGGLGNRELNTVRRQMDERILAAGGYTEGRGEETTGIPHAPQGEVHQFLRDHPDPQALYQGALRRQAKDEEGREFSASYSAMSQGRREQEQKTQLFRETGREHDASMSRERLSQVYALPTQINRAQENLAAAQRAHEEALAAHVDIMEDVSTGNVYHKKNNPSGVTPAQVEAAKVRRDSTAESVQNWQGEVNSLRERLAAQKDSFKASTDGNKEIIRRYDDISVNARAARALVRTLPQDLVEENERPPVESVLPSRQRAAELKRRRTEAQRLLTSLDKDPEGFAQRSKATLESEQAKEHERALEEQRVKQATINERLAAATAALPATAEDRLAFQKRMESASPRTAKRMAQEHAAAQAELSQVLEERRSGVPLVEGQATLPPEARFSNVSTGKARQRLKDEIEGYTNELEGTGRREFGSNLTAEARAERIRPQLTAFGIPAAKAATLSFGTNAQIEKALLEAATKMDEAAVKQQQAADKAEAKQDREDGFTTTPAVKRQRKGKKAKKFGQVVDDADGTETEEDDEATPSAKKKKRSGTNANVSGETSAAERDAATKILNDRKAVLQAEHDEILARKQAADQGKRDLGGNRQANRKNLSEEQVTALDGFVAASATAKEELTRVNSEMHNLNTEVLRLRGKVKQAADATEPATATGGGTGGGSKPPRRPAATGGGGDEPPDGEGKPRPRSAAERSNDAFNNAQHLANFAQFSPDVQAAVQTAARNAGVKPGSTLTDAQKEAILPSLLQFRDDPMYGKYDAKTARRTFAAGAGITLPGDVGNQRFLTDSFNLNKAGPGSSSAIQGVRDLTRVEEALAIESVKVREALLAQIAAEERLAAVRANPNSTAGQIARAERGVSTASRQYEMAKLADGSPPVGGIGKLLQSGGQQAIRFASFQIAFTGIEKVRELVDTGIQAQTQFIRLQANLEATGRSANGLMQALGDISSQTAQPLAHTIQAASELTGVLKTKGDLLEGAKIASELANISHGMLTATQAAIGLRDVTDAYGLSGVAALQGVGDMIAKVSQVTGVSVHDVIEGTTQLAQEAHSFGLSQRMAAVLAAEVTKNTGESGESAAEQVSRILSTFNNGKVQQLLAKTVVPQFNAEGQKNKDAGQTVVPQELFDQAGGIGQGLTRLLAMYDQLTPAQQHAIDALVGTGRQARALTGVLRDAATASKLLNDVQDDQGALAKQNAAFLRTLGGAVQKLGADFRNLGADLMQAHVFDILMLVVGAVDKLMTSVDALFRVFGLANDNPLTKSLLQMIILLGEVSLAFKVFGGEKAAAFGMGMAQRVGLGGFFTSVGAARTQQAEAAAASGGPTFIPFRRTRAMGTVLNDTYQGRRPPVIVPGGRFVTDSAGTTEEMLGNPFVGRTAGIPAATRFATNSAGVTTEEMLGNPFTGTLAATEAEVTASKLAGLGTGIVALGKSVGGPLLAISALMYLFDQFGKAGAAAKATEAHSRSLEDEITGKSAADRKKDAEKTHQDDVLSQEDKAAKIRESTRPRRGFGGYLRDVVDVPKTVKRARNIITGDTSQGQTSDRFETTQANNYLKYGRELDAASATKDPRKVVAAQKAIDKEIADGAEKLVKTAGDRDARDRAWALLYQVKAQLDADAQKRTQTLMGIADVDQLSLQQLENIQTFTGKWSSVSNRVLRVDPRAAQDDLSDTGVDPHSAIGRAAARSLTGNTLQRTEARIDLDKLELPQLDVQIAAKALGDPDRDRLIKARDAVFSNLQQQMDLADQLTISNADAFASILQKSGDLTGASSSLQQEVQTIKKAMIELGPTDSGFSGYLSQLSDKNQQIADLGVQDQVQNLTLSNARNPNSVSTAKNNAAIAALHLQATRDAANKDRADLQDTVLKPAQANLADAQKRQADFVPSGIGRPDGFIGPYINPMDAATSKDLADGVAAANVALKTAQTQVTASAADKTAAVSAAMAAKIQADQAVTQSLQDQLVSANNLKVVMLQAAGAGTLAMDAQRLANANQEVAFATKTFGAGSTQENNAKASALQAGIQQKQDTYDQGTSTMSLRAAIQTNAGDMTGAARTNLAKANSDVAFAVATWGKDSKQANDARAAAIAANANLQKEIDDALNAALDLEISMLSNRGNDSDKRQILTDKVKQAQNNLNAFTAKGGKLASPEGQRLQANVNDARRSRIDQGAQIEIDTLEFQHATFKISASQEIAALQNILKTKQLTQDRARSIMLQIKGLQGEMQGQFNLGDIKLPSVYDVRRVMASGRAGAVAAASSIGYQDNRTINIQINGGQLDKVKAAMTDVLGTTATSRVTVAPKKGV